MTLMVFVIIKIKVKSVQNNPVNPVGKTVQTGIVGIIDHLLSLYLYKIPYI